TVLDHHRLAQRLLQLRRDHAGQRVVERAGGERHDVAKRFRRPCLSPGHLAENDRSREDQKFFHHWSAFTPAVLMTLAHLAISESRKRAACSGLLPTGSMPIWLKRSLMSDSLIALAVSAARRLTISRGVPPGAMNSTQVE